MKPDISTNTQLRPVHLDQQILVPDPPETWSAEEIEFLLWPDTLDHLPVRQKEEGWAQLLGNA